jgi:pentatricopeptide repeat protein
MQRTTKTAGNFIANSRRPTGPLFALNYFCWLLLNFITCRERCDIAKTRTHVKFYYRILKEGGLEKTHALLKVLERHKVPVDVGMVNAYIEECMQLFEIALMEKFWRDHVETPDGGIREGSVDATTLALLVEGFAGRGHIENAIHYFEKIKGVARLQGNIMHVYNTLVDACLKLGYTHVAEQYKCEMARLINQ